MNVCCIATIINQGLQWTVLFSHSFGAHSSACMVEEDTQTWSGSLTHWRSQSYVVVSNKRCKLGKLEIRLIPQVGLSLEGPSSVWGFFWRPTCQVPRNHSGSQWPLAFGHSPDSHQVSLPCPLASGGGHLLILILTHSRPPHLVESSGSGFTSKAKGCYLSIVLAAVVLSPSLWDLPSCLTAGTLVINSRSGCMLLQARLQPSRGENSWMGQHS